MKSINKNEGKPRLSLLLKDLALPVEELVRLMEDSLEKYERGNWHLSCLTENHDAFYDENLESLARHLFEAMKGKKVDPQSHGLHMLHIALRALYGAYYDLMNTEVSSD